MQVNEENILEGLLVVGSSTFLKGLKEGILEGFVKLTKDEVLWEGILIIYIYIRINLVIYQLVLSVFNQ